jgi:hypothetical protein
VLDSLRRKDISFKYIFPHLELLPDHLSKAYQAPESSPSLLLIHRLLFPQPSSPCCAKVFLCLILPAFLGLLNKAFIHKLKGILVYKRC